MKTGFIGIIGRPNAGKSTFLNAVLEVPLSPVSRKAQTTRNRITGILNRSQAQYIFFDTPGITGMEKPLNRILNNTARGTLELSDVVLYFIDSRNFSADPELTALFSRSKKPVITVLNKTDAVKKEGLLPIMEKLSGFDFIKEIIPVSALKKKGLERLLNTIAEYLPESDMLYPEEYVSANPEKFLIAEAIKGAIFKKTSKEVPYSCAVYVEKVEEKKNIIVAYCTIFTARESQKGIIIGKAGAMVKRIGMKSRADLEELFGKKFFLELYVKTKKNWQKDNNFLRMLGYIE